MIKSSILVSAGEPPSVAEIAKFIRGQYGWDVSLTKLASERDDVYRVTNQDGRQYLFKLIHPAEDPAAIDFQTQALLHIEAAAPILPVPRLVSSMSKSFQTIWTGRGGGRREARMFTYLEGVPLKGVPSTPLLAAGLGRLTAQLDVAMKDFVHPAGQRELLWDLQHAAKTFPLLTHTRSSPDRRLCERVIDHFEKDLTREMAGLRRQIIHNDLNPHNVLVHRTDSDHPVGIIDFGDMVRAPLINELAVAAAYLLTASDAPLGTIPEFLSAYHSINPLDPLEIALLPKLIAVRYAIVIAITNWRAAEFPENRSYIVRNQSVAIEGLHKLSALPNDTVRQLLEGAVLSVAS